MADAIDAILVETVVAARSTVVRIVADIVLDRRAFVGGGFVIFQNVTRIIDDSL